MVESGVIIEGHALPAGGAGPAPSDGIEQRVRRLEDAVAQLQDTRPLEDRVVARVSERLGNGRSSATGLLVEAGRHLLPAALDAARRAEPANGTPVARPPWLIVDLYAELRTAALLFLDPRYRASWAARVVPVAAAVLAFCSWFFLGHILLIGFLLDKLVDVVLVLVVYKVLHREVCRYRAAVGNLFPVPRP